tara:strand:+ start:599 stop:850 length:252 start_codon:yes stop_codon:yes gene_type:complete
MIQTYRDFVEADTRAEGLFIRFRDVYAILETKWSDVEEHCFRLRGNERWSYEDRLEHTLELLSKEKWLLYLDKYGNIYSGAIM